MHRLIFRLAGLGLVASMLPDELERSVALGRVMGGGAVGVLLGYPIGGILFQVLGVSSINLGSVTLSL